MATKDFTRDYLKRDLGLPLAAIEDRIVHKNSLATFHEIFFQDKDGKFYRTIYSVSIKEGQGEAPWYDEPVVPCTQVKPEKVITTKWVPIEEVTDGLDTP